MIKPLGISGLNMGFLAYVQQLLSLVYTGIQYLMRSGDIADWSIAVILKLQKKEV